MIIFVATIYTEIKIVMMKTLKYLVVSLVMLVSASAMAQDSCREAVKEFLMGNGQYEMAKSFISSISGLFEGNGQIDIKQLTQRYLDEQFDDDLVEWLQPRLTARSVTEADLRKVVSLLSMPEFKTYDAHYVDWMEAFMSEIESYFYETGWAISIAEELDTAEDADREGKEMVIVPFPPVEPEEGIDPAYAAKFKDVILESVFAQNMLNAMVEYFNDEDPSGPLQKKVCKVFNDWVYPSFPNLLLNNAYGIMTLEDLDFASLLYSDDTYCRLIDLYGNDDQDYDEIGIVGLKYVNWMKERGATEIKNPKDALKFWTSLFNVDDLNLDEIDLDDLRLDNIDFGNLDLYGLDFSK